jgi:hypothetical protein
VRPTTVERLSTPCAGNQTGQRVEHDWDALPFALPDDYKEFLELFNGYCGFLGTSYVHWHPFEELLESNEAYEMQSWWPGMFMIGTDGGGEGHAINSSGQYLQFDMTGDLLELLANNFDDFVDHFYSYDWGEDD